MKTTEFVSEKAFPAFKSNARKLGLRIIMSAPTGGGFYVTTAPVR